MFDELEQLYRIRENVINWSSGWSGTANWNSALDHSFIMAMENNRVERWREQIMDHQLPVEQWKVRKLWRLRLELAEVLIRGITILEIKTLVLPGLCTVRYTDMERAQESDDEGQTTEVSKEDSGNSDNKGGRGLTLREMEIEGDMWGSSGEEYVDSDDEDMQSQ
ncbi:hypothetical protein DXG01_009453 [Tephrocybe rancida]|nr:hypothetical protein DXG01_009453 [Tephrocybe rancida]